MAFFGDLWANWKNQSPRVTLAKSYMNDAKKKLKDEEKKLEADIESLARRKDSIDKEIEGKRKAIADIKNLLK